MPSRHWIGTARRHTMLREFQSLFCRSLFENKDVPVARFIHETKANDAEMRFDIHRNNVQASLVEVIRAAFPAVSYFAGKDNFSYAAGRFIEAYPPRLPRFPCPFSQPLARMRAREAKG